MSDSAGELNLPSKPLQRMLIFGDMGQQGLDRNPLAKLEVFGFVDLAHAAVAQRAEDTKATEQDGASGKSGRYLQPRRKIRAKVFVERTARTTSRRTAIGVAWL